jgi:quercetin dioxygenase-like cupin family protein
MKPLPALALALLALVCPSLLSAADAASAKADATTAAPKTSVTVLAKIPHPSLADHEIVVLQLDLPPGASSPHHRHPGLVVGNVVSGEFEFQITNEPLRRLRAGEVFFEPPGVVHLVSRNPSPTTPARVIAFMEHPAGSPLVLPDAATHEAHKP